jgi:hypothetical protein
VGIAHRLDHLAEVVDAASVRQERLELLLRCALITKALQPVPPEPPK